MYFPMRSMTNLWCCVKATERSVTVGTNILLLGMHYANKLPPTWIRQGLRMCVSAHTQVHACASDMTN